MLASLLTWLHTRLDILLDPQDLSSETGFSTAELLGNAALGIAALVVIWQGISRMGVDLVEHMRTALGL